MKVKFYGNGLVWGMGRGIALFENGEFISTNEDVINILIERGYKHDILEGAPKKEPPSKEEEKPKPKKRGRKKAK